MHGECARRAGYYMECGKTDNENNNDNEPSNETPSNAQSSGKKNSKSKRSKKNTVVFSKNKNLLKIFCERHRPFKLIKEIQEKQDSATEELTKFCKTMRKALDVMSRIPYK